MERQERNESAVSPLLSSPLLFPVFFLLIISPLLTSSANELTVGKVYAALMIFDYYKQNRARRLQMQQQQQQSASGSQVRHAHLTCLHTTHHTLHKHTHSHTHTCTAARTHLMQYCKPVCMQPHKSCLHTLIHTFTVCLHVYTHATIVLLYPLTIK